MANPGLGYRTVNSLLMEISYHFLQQIVNTTLTAAVVAPGVQTVTISSLIGIYVGALVVVDTGNSQQEIIQITAFNAGASTITANFLNTHAIGASIQGGTFSLQQPTDPFYTQSEVLGYIARAQNEFLAMVPCIFSLEQQSISFGQIFQTVPCNMIEINRIAISPLNIALTSLTRTANVVSGVSPTPHGLIPGEKFSIIISGDSTFLGSFKVDTVPTALTFTYRQDGGNATVATPVLGAWSRLYEVSQEELTMQNRDWQNNFAAVLRAWFEDRAGAYAWGVSGKPASNYPAELLLSIRDSDTLTLTDGFLIPDLVLHFPKYLAMSWMYDKDGEQRNPKMAKYCRMRFDRGVMATKRWVDGMVNAQAAAARR